MRSQFWKTIEPVDGQPIPPGAEYGVTVWGSNDEWTSWQPWLGGTTFDERSLSMLWRVPIALIPMPIAVNAIASSAQFNHDKQQYEVWIVDGYTSGCTEQALKDAIASHLRELADKEFPNA